MTKRWYNDSGELEKTEESEDDSYGCDFEYTHDPQFGTYRLTSAQLKDNKPMINDDDLAKAPSVSKLWFIIPLFILLGLAFYQIDKSNNYSQPKSEIQAL